ncbi:MAG: prepilin-type N-terminal cleavage/methylation domain-containing protein [Myxococcota bacterium]
MTEKHKRAGFTLIETLVGISIGVFLTAAAVTFVRFETRLMGVNTERLDMQQAGRASLDLIASDVQLAGLGMTLDDNNDFPGLLTGAFNIDTVPFGLSSVTLESGPPASTIYAVPVSDFGIRFAAGEQASIVGWDPSTQQMRMCDHAALDVENGDTIIVRDEQYLSSRAIRVDGLTQITNCRCAEGCYDLTWSAPDPTQTFVSFTGAAAVDYNLGAAFTDYSTVVYFLLDQGGGLNRASLRRAQFDPDNAGNCVARDGTCGVEMARDVEAFALETWAFDTGAAQWSVVPVGNPVPGDQKLRVDIELVTRSRQETDGVKRQVRSNILGVDFPPGGVDKIEREVFRTSVEIKNVGRPSI